MELDRTPKHDLESEASVISSVLLDNDAFHKVSLKPSDFYNDAHKTLWRYICKMFNKGDSVGVMTLKAELDRDNELDGIGGAYYITQLFNTEPTATRICDYAEIVHTTSLKRQLVALLSRGINSVFSGELNTSELIEANIRSLMEMASSSESDKNDIVHISEEVEGVIEEFENSVENEGLIGVPSGFDKLDNLTGGFRNSDLIVLAGRPAMGKTAFALNMAMGAAEQAVKTGIFSVEMTTRQLIARAITSDSEIERRRLERGCNLNSSEWKKLAATQARISSLPIWINDKAGITMSELRSKARKMVLDHGVQWILVDYLGKIRRERGSKSSDFEHISHTICDLKLLARELQIPIVVLSQLSRGLESRPNKRPIPADLRQSGDIEQEANIILFLYRDIVYNDGASPNEAEVIVAKNRDGMSGTIPLTWRGSITKYMGVS